MKNNKISGNRSQHVKIKYPWIKDLNIKTKDKERRARRRKINKIKDALENLSYREITVIDHMIKSMIKNSSPEYEYKKERRN